MAEKKHGAFATNNVDLMESNLSVEISTFKDSHLSKVESHDSYFLGENLELDSKNKYKIILEKILSGSYEISNLDGYDINGLGNFVLEEIKNEKYFTPLAKLSVKIIFFSSFENIARVSTLTKKLLEISKSLVNLNDGSYNEFYDLLTENLSSSQLKKLYDAFVPEEALPEVTAKLKTRKRKKQERTRKRAIKKRNNRTVSIKNRVKVTEAIINLMDNRNRYGSTPNSVNSNYKVSFFGLDDSAREAVCWRELEREKTGNKDLARLAGAVAWNIWLFKKPLLQKYCEEKGIEYKKLGFLETAELTKEAMAYFSEEEIGEILDGAVERKMKGYERRYVEGAKEKKKGHAVSIGAEFEIIKPKFELGLIYAWYESLDREKRGDKLTDNPKIEEGFMLLAEVKDAKRDYEYLFKELEALEEFLNGPYIKGMPPGDLKNLKKRRKEYRQNLKKAEKYYLGITKLLEKLLLIPDEESTYSPQNSFSRSTGWVDFPKVSDIAIEAFDMFTHHMSQLQSLGHRHTTDSFGEHAFDFNEGDSTRDPYGLYLREIWELAEGGFHDLEVDRRPLHVTLGFYEYALEAKEKNRAKFLEIGYNDFSNGKELKIYQESSLLNFVMYSTGWANRELIESFRDLDRKKKKRKQRATIVSFKDTGRSTAIRARHEGTTALGLEFRMFAPSKRDLPRLFSALGDLGTAMVSYIKINEGGSDKIDKVDLELAEVWGDFREKAMNIYMSGFSENYKLKLIQSGEYKKLFFDANYWVKGNPDFVNQFYRKMSDDFDQPEGVVADMRTLVRDTKRKVKDILEG